MKTSKAKTGARHTREKALRGTHHGGPAGSKILAAIEEATEILRSEGLESKRLTVRTYKVAPTRLAAINPETSSGCEHCSGRARRCWRVFSA
jgi:hypothetical protein